MSSRWILIVLYNTSSSYIQKKYGTFSPTCRAWERKKETFRWRELFVFRDTSWQQRNKMRDFSVPHIVYMPRIRIWISNVYCTIVAHSQFVNSLAPRYLCIYSSHNANKCVSVRVVVWTRIHSEMRWVIFAVK